MAHAGPRARSAAAHILRQYRFARRYPARYFYKARYVTDTFDIEGNCLRLFVIPQVFQSIGDIDVGAVAHADRLAEPYPFLAKVGDRLGYVGSALRGKSQGTGLRDIGHDGGV